MNSPGSVLSVLLPELETENVTTVPCALSDTLTAMTDHNLEYYNAHAAEYAAHWNERIPGQLAAFAELLDRSSHVLDAGCGTGRDSAWLTDAGYSSVGLDYSPAMLAEARKRFDGRLVAGDLRDLPFGENTFDGVWAWASLVHLTKDDATTALSEICRVLRPDGVACISVKSAVRATVLAGDTRTFTTWTLPELADALIEVGFSAFSISHNRGAHADWFTVTAGHRRLLEHPNI